MASPANRKTAQPAEGTEFPPLDLAALAKQRKV
jgi:ubiquitin-conjugating enzyme E2 variant